MAEIYRIGRTKVESTRMSNGYTLLNLTPFMRRDLTERIRALDTSDFPPEVIRAESLSRHATGGYSLKDLPFHKIIRKAADFKFVYERTEKPANVSFDYDLYHNSFKTFWYSGYTELDVRLDLIRKTKSYAELILSDTDIKAMEIKCKDDVLKYLFQNSLRSSRMSIKRLLPQAMQKETIIWQGYLEENNFWPMFKYDSRNATGQIDDSYDAIKGLYINPWASFTMEYKDRVKLDNDSLVTAAIVDAICFNTPYLGYKIK